MLTGVANAAPTYERTGRLTNSATSVSIQEQCVRYVDFDIYTVALMDQQQLRELEANLCP